MSIAPPTEVPVSTVKRQQAFETVDRLTELPMLLLSLAIIPLLLVPLVLDLSTQVHSAILVADWMIWSLFALELIVKTCLAPHRVAYLRSHWFDVLLVALPFLRPLRVVRSARALRLLRLGRAAVALSAALSITRQILESHGLKYALAAGGLTVVSAAVIVTIFESQQDGANIQNLADGLWWAATTITTVGYGDRFPVTPEGRGVAVFLMLAGITFFSVVTANIAAYLVKPAQEEVTLDAIMKKLEEIESRLDSWQGADR